MIFWHLSLQDQILSFWVKILFLKHEQCGTALVARPPPPRVVQTGILWAWLLYTGHYTGGRRFIDLLLSPDYYNHKNLWNCHKIKHTIYQITTQRIVHNDIGNHLAKTSQKGCQKFLVICQEFKSCLYTSGIWRERKLMPMPLAHYKLLNFNCQGIFLSVWDVFQIGYWIKD